ncbi:MAG: SDR family oxidoreductase [Rhodospirillaceae bacterium]|nr:SDR family oxidoreductase [Rhodospirillaceae bacterium]
MRVVITGGAGFVGQKLAQALVKAGTLDGTPIGELVLFDVVEPTVPAGAVKVTTQTGDIADRAAVDALITPDTGAVFHLAAIVSHQAEAEFDTGMAINLDGTRWVLEACRRLPKPIKVLFTSSIAAYGGDIPMPVADDINLLPQTSYGTQKVVCELLVNDYSRKGFIDGRSLRLPTVVVRPGRPNRAASTWVSSIIREPLQGETAICPVDDTVRMWCASPRTVVKCILHGYALPAAAYGANRALLLPGFVVSVRETVDSLRRVAGDKVAARVKFEKNPVIAAIVDRWVSDFAPKRAIAMGFPVDTSMDDLVRWFIEDDLAPEHRKAQTA